jgi:hypothetical protein
MPFGMPRPPNLHVKRHAACHWHAGSEPAFQMACSFAEPPCHGGMQHATGSEPACQGGMLHAIWHAGSREPACHVECRFRTCMPFGMLHASGVQPACHSGMQHAIRHAGSDDPPTCMPKVACHDGRQHATGMLHAKWHAGWHAKWHAGSYLAGQIGRILFGRPNRNLGCWTCYSKIFVISGNQGPEHVIEHLDKFAKWPAK